MGDGESKRWTREELILAINLYLKTPFGRIHVRNPEIIALASRLGRTPGSISYKLANFASLDPSLPRKGAANVSRLDREVWAEFFADLDSMVYASEVDLGGAVAEDGDWVTRVGEERTAEVRVRVNQRFFRRMVLAAYGERCCVTGIAAPELLVASHIVPWAANAAERLNPRNGLCLNALYDRAFDRGLVSLDADYRLLVSKRLRHDLFRHYEGVPIALPQRFLPDPAFLEWHREELYHAG